MPGAAVLEAAGQEQGGDWELGLKRWKWRLNNSVLWGFGAGDLLWCAKTWHSFGCGQRSWKNSFFPRAAWNEDFPPGIMNHEEELSQELSSSHSLGFSGRAIPPLKKWEEGVKKWDPCTKGELAAPAAWLGKCSYSSFTPGWIYLPAWVEVWLLALQAIQPCLSPRRLILEIPRAWHAKYI